MPGAVFSRGLPGGWCSAGLLGLLLAGAATLSGCATEAHSPACFPLADVQSMEVGPGSAAPAAAPIVLTSPDGASRLTIETSVGPGGDRLIVRRVSGGERDGAEVRVLVRPDAAGRLAIVQLQESSQRALMVFDEPLVQGLDGPAAGQGEAPARVQKTGLRVLRDGQVLRGEAEQAVRAVDVPPAVPGAASAEQIDLSIRIGPSTTRSRTVRALDRDGAVLSETRDLTVRVLGITIERTHEQWGR